MSNEVLTSVWKHSKQSGSKLLLLAAIADYSNFEGWAWPSIKSLCKRTRLGERYVQKMIAEISKDGELEVRERIGSSNYYRVILPDVGGVNYSSGGGEPQCTQGVNPSAPITLIEPKRTLISRFTPPSIEETKAYAKEQGLPEEEGEKFYEHHSARGWMSGKTKITRWKMAFATWKRNYFKFNSNASKTSKPYTPSTPSTKTPTRANSAPWHASVGDLIRNVEAGEGRDCYSLWLEESIKNLGVLVKSWEELWCYLRTLNLSEEVKKTLNDHGAKI